MIDIMVSKKKYIFWPNAASAKISQYSILLIPTIDRSMRSFHFKCFAILSIVWCDWDQMLISSL